MDKLLINDSMLKKCIRKFTIQQQGYKFKYNNINYNFGSNA